MPTLIDFSPWTMATGNLDWGAQNAIHTALSLAAEGKSSIVYGADYSSDGGACLVNTVGQMLAVGGGSGIPSKHFNVMVHEFDRINRVLRDRGVNTDTQRMSPNAAMILLHHFGPLKPAPENVIALTSYDSDEDFAAAWLGALSTDAIPEDEIREVVDPVKELDYAEGPNYEGFDVVYYGNDD